jgi:hypothetical protein
VVWTRGDRALAERYRGCRDAESLRGAMTPALLTYVTRYVVAPNAGLAAVAPNVAQVQHYVPLLSAVGLLVAGGVAPVALLVYWVLNSSWTLGRSAVISMVPDAGHAGRRTMVRAGDHSRPAMERDLAGGCAGREVVAVVGPVVVPLAEGDEVGEVGLPAFGPSGLVVEVGGGRWSVAAFGFAAAGLDELRDPLSLGGEPGRPAEVQDL